MILMCPATLLLEDVLLWEGNQNCCDFIVCVYGFASTGACQFIASVVLDTLVSAGRDLSLVDS